MRWIYIYGRREIKLGVMVVVNALEKDISRGPMVDDVGGAPRDPNSRYTSKVAVVVVVVQVPE